ncbi:mediator complex subunit [Malassezia yamatoensis]|uniref:Mediator of RNA polymerase II transcription subunit 14 n=1 Tax=Malassezia yamatoensis TaxID=253288 RepID=A0AAJ6CIE8_9BASI|nr:mediator complex subunit [Malassezia yamatoensis]
MTGMPCDRPQEELLEELPVEQADLIPLVALVERLSNNAYQTLQNLSETLPAMSSDAKKAKIFTTSLELRRNFIKLLVLVRWCKDVELLNKARNIIALLADQQWAHEDVFSGLTQTRRILPNARICDADLVTAIEVLRTGTYKRLPTVIRDSAIPPERMSDADVLDLLDELDRVLAVRLACNASFPGPFQLMRISDGKAYFQVEGVYDACLTTSGPNDDDRWWLLGFHFSDSASNIDEEQSDSLDIPYLTQIFATAESILAQNDISKEPVLVQLHTFLEQQAFERRLAILYHQLQHCSRLHWAGNLRYFLDTNSQKLEVQYWISRGDLAGKGDKKKALHNDLLKGSLRVYVHKEPLRGVGRVLSSLAMGSVSDDFRQCAIHVEWDVDQRVRSELQTVPDFGLDPLDVESLVLRAIDRHSLALMTFFQKQIVQHASLGAGNDQFCILRSLTMQGFGPSHALEIKLTEQVRILLYVSTITGRFGIKSLVTTPSEPNNSLRLCWNHSEDLLLLHVSDKINANPSSLIEQLIDFRMQCLTRELEAEAQWLGVTPGSAAGLHVNELKKFGITDATILLYLPLKILPRYYMSVMFIPNKPLGIALLSVRTVLNDSKSSLVINSVKWLDRKHLNNVVKPQASGEAGFHTMTASTSSTVNITEEELQFAYDYCVATVVYTHLEEQLRVNSFAFQAFDPLPDTLASSGNLPPELPTINVVAGEILAPFSAFAKNDVSIRVCNWWEASKRCIETSFPIEVNIPFQTDSTLNLFDNMRLDVKDGRLVYQSSDLSLGVTRFLSCWHQVGRILSLIKCTSIYKGQNGFHIAAKSIHERKVTLVYGQKGQDSDFLAEVTFNSPDESSLRNKVSLCFAREHDAKGDTVNPHQYIASFLEAKLNSLVDTTIDYWKGLITVCTSKRPTIDHKMLESTLSILASLAPYLQQAQRNATCPEVLIRDASWYQVEIHHGCVPKIPNQLLTIVEHYSTYVF